MEYRPMIVSASKFLSLPITALLLSATLAQASGHRADTRNLSCAAAISIVQSRGAVVLSTGRYTYDRFVKNHNYCQYGEKLQSAYVPTADYRRCNIGYICKEPIFYND